MHPMCKRKIGLLLISWLPVTACFCPSLLQRQVYDQRLRNSIESTSTDACRNYHPRRRRRHGLSSNEHMTESSLDDDLPPHPLAETSFLSHAMLKVPSVDKTVQYWTDKGGKIRTSKLKDSDASNGNVELMSAFVELGSSSNNQEQDESSSSSSVCFALELVSTSSSSSKEYSIGNSISYIGVSMLLQFQNNLLGVISGQQSVAPQGDEPNGIPVQSAASAPGDFLARLAFHSKDLESTLEFYTSVLGMTVKAHDDTMLCLRYDNDCFKRGVPTTLVFDKLGTDEPLELGDCFDHVVVATRTPVDKLYDQFQNNPLCDKRIFMKPTDMFGKQVMGLIDPNGYKVIIAS